MLFVVVAAGLFLWQYPRTTEFGTSGKFFQEEVERLSGEVVALLSEQEYERVLMDYASEGFQRKVDEKDLKYAAMEAGSDWGTFHEIKTSTFAEMKKAGKWYALAEIEAEYENQDVTFTFSFDREMGLAGIYMR